MKYPVAIVDFLGDYVTAVSSALTSLHCAPEQNSSYLIKPNMLNSKTAYEGVTTDPKIVRALIGMLKEKGCRVYVGD